MKQGQKSYVCRDCGKKKPQGEYYVRYGGYREKHCKACAAVRRRKRAETAVDETQDQSARECSMCGKLLPAYEFAIVQGRRLRRCGGCVNMVRRARMARKRKEKTGSGMAKVKMKRKTDDGRAERVARLRCRLDLERVLGLALLLKRWDVRRQTFLGFRNWNCNSRGKNTQ